MVLFPKLTAVVCETFWYFFSVFPDIVFAFILSFHARLIHEDYRGSSSRLSQRPITSSFKIFNWANPCMCTLQSSIRLLIVKVVEKSFLSHFGFKEAVHDRCPQLRGGALQKTSKFFENYGVSARTSPERVLRQCRHFVDKWVQFFDFVRALTKLSFN